MKVLVKKEELVEVDIELPIYSKNEIDIHDRYTTTVYMKIYKNMDGIICRDKISIHHYSEIEISHEEYFSINGMNASADYKLGRGDHESSPEEFYGAVEKAQKYLNNIKNNSKP